MIDPLVYSTYIGGSDHDRAYAIAVDGGGYAYVAGATLGPHYNVTAGAFQTTFAGSWDAFVTKLNASGGGLVYSTYLGGIGDEAGFSIAVDGSGHVYVVGATQSPTTM